MRVKIILLIVVNILGAYLPIIIIYIYNKQNNFHLIRFINDDFFFWRKF